jgi:hypothetical protein
MNSHPTSTPDANIRTEPNYIRVNFADLEVGKFYYTYSGVSMDEGRSHDIDVYQVIRKDPDSITVTQYFPRESPNEQGVYEGEYIIPQSHIDGVVAMYKPVSAGGSRKTRRIRRTMRRRNTARRRNTRR